MPSNADSMATVGSRFAAAGMDSDPVCLLWRESGLAFEVVVRLDDAHRSRLRAHDDRVRGGAAGRASDAAEHGAVGDAGGGEHHVAMRQVEHVVFARQIGDAATLGAAALVVVAEQQASLHLAADAA